MSKYLTFTAAAFKSRELLLQALADLGYTADQVEEGHALPLYGYRGDKRTETAQIVVRRRHIGHASNDLGFAKTDQGYVPIISEYDMDHLARKHGQVQGMEWSRWQEETRERGGIFAVKLRTAYNQRVVEEVARRQHGTVLRQQTGQTIKLTVRY